MNKLIIINLIYNYILIHKTILIVKFLYVLIQSISIILCDIKKIEIKRIYKKSKQKKGIGVFFPSNMDGFKHQCKYKLFFSFLFSIEWIIQKSLLSLEEEFNTLKLVFYIQILHLPWITGIVG